ncbi:ABC transporter ATP-binding protein, partial [bacterium]|nr:ABC transporter ATP-binding protein [bacterium]
MPLIQIQNVSKVYQRRNLEVRSLDMVNLNVEKGEFVVIYGVSGSGKTTLLNLIGGLDKPTSGKIIVDSLDLTTQDDEQLATYRRNKIGFIFQGFNLIPTLTAFENVLFPLVPVSMSEDEKRKRAREIMNMILPNQRLWDQLPVELSGGEQQRVAIARALVNNPEIILADEPTSDLDRKTSEQIIDLLWDAYKKGCTVII